MALGPEARGEWRQREEAPFLKNAFVFFLQTRCLVCQSPTRFMSFFAQLSLCLGELFVWLFIFNIFYFTS